MKSKKNLASMLAFLLLITVGFTACNNAPVDSDPDIPAVEDPIGDEDNDIEDIDEPIEEGTPSDEDVDADSAD